MFTLMILLATFVPLGVVSSLSAVPATPQTSFDNHLVRRQAPAGCGTGSSVDASGFASLCQQCRVDTSGAAVGFTNVAALARSIRANGVPAAQATVLQASIQAALNTRASQTTTRARCASRCAADARCASFTFRNRRCVFVANNYIVNNQAGRVLANAFQALFNQGGTSYCSICSGDASCLTPSARARRSIQMARVESIRKRATTCPSGLTGCPITFSTLAAFQSLTESSKAYECLNVKEELTSCGGCVTLGEGIDCSAIEGVVSAGCSAGKCHIFSCDRDSGYVLSKRHNKCRKLSTRK